MVLRHHVRADELSSYMERRFLLPIPFGCFHKKSSVPALYCTELWGPAYLVWEGLHLEQCQTKSPIDGRAGALRKKAGHYHCITPLFCYGAAYIDVWKAHTDFMPREVLHLFVTARCWATTTRHHDPQTKCHG